MSDDPGADQPFSIVEEILLWEPRHLELLGKEDNGPYDRLASSFPDDSGPAFDGLNYPFTGLPSNGGNAWYNAWAWLDSPATATPEGLLVTTFVFEAGKGGTAELQLPPEYGENTFTRVHDPDNPDGFVTGTLGPPAVVNIEPVIPTVSEWAMIGMAGLVLAGGGLCSDGDVRSRHRRPHVWVAWQVPSHF